MPDTPNEKFQLSLVQVIAAALASITSAVILSYFGVAGTILGTAIGSIVSTVGVAVYTHTIRRARRGVSHVPLRRQHDAIARQDRSPAPVAHGRQPSVAWNRRELGARPPAQAQPSRFSRVKAWFSGLGRWQRVGVYSGTMFVVVLAVLVGVQYVAGFSITEVVHGRGTSGTAANAGCIVNADSCRGQGTTPTPGATPGSGSGTTAPTAVPSTVPTSEPTSGVGTTPAPNSTPESTPSPLPLLTPSPQGTPGTTTGGG